MILPNNVYIDFDPIFEDLFENPLEANLRLTSTNNYFHTGKWKPGDPQNDMYDQVRDPLDSVAGCCLEP